MGSSIGVTLNVHDWLVTATVIGLVGICVCVVGLVLVIAYIHGGFG